MTSHTSESKNPATSVRLRQTESLYHALGPLVSEALARPDVVEVMANPDGSLWVDRAGVGREKVGHIEQSAAETTIRLLASHMGETVTPDRPAVAGVLPRSGERFQGLLPPLAERPVFTIRKRASIVFTLDDYVTKGILSAAGAGVIRGAVVERQNILVAGGTGSGKTTLVNAILAEPAFKRDRIILIEDTKELQCPANDKVELLTKSTEPQVTMIDLLRMTLRLRPDRIIIGEIRAQQRRAFGSVSRRRGAGNAQGVEHRSPRWGRHHPCKQRGRRPASGRGFGGRGIRSGSQAINRGCDQSGRLHRTHSSRSGPGSLRSLGSYRIRSWRVPGA